MKSKNKAVILGTSIFEKTEHTTVVSNNLADQVTKTRLQSYFAVAAKG